MKKLFGFLPILLIVFVGLATWSCSDDHDDIISPNALPADARAFVSKYFPGESIISSYKEGYDYEVIVSDGTRIDFDREGNWTEVDAAMGKSIPSGFYPAAIDRYIEINMAGIGINEISVEADGYEVELLTGSEFMFDSEGTLICAE